MSTTGANDHPIKRVRRTFRGLPSISGLNSLSGAKQFARWIGCSESLIRNVETGAAEFSQKLAETIERKTQVSAAWLLSNPGPDEPIRDINGEEWSPRWIDVFSAHPDLGLLYRVCPSLLPRVIAKLVEAELRQDFFEGKRGHSVAILQSLFRKGAFKSGKFCNHLSHAIGEDEAFRDKYLDCLDLALNESQMDKQKKERNLHLLKGLEPDPPEDSRISKLMDERIQPTE